MRLIFYLKYQTKFGEQLSLKLNTGQQGNFEEIEMIYLNENYWKAVLDITLTADYETISYHYIFKGTDGMCTEEYPQPRTLHLQMLNKPVVKLYDTWNFAGTVANTFCTTPFTDILLPDFETHAPQFKKENTHIFKVKAPLLEKNQ